jgi:Peptidase C13 family
MKFFIADLVRNLRQGLRAMLLQRVTLDEFRITPEQLVALVALVVAAQWAMDIAFTGRHGNFNVYALTVEMTVIMGLLLAAFAAAKLTREPRLLLGYPIALLAMDPLFLVLQGLLRAYGESMGWLYSRAFYIAILAWFLLAAWMALLRFAPGRPGRAAMGFAVYLALFFAGYWWLPPQNLWVALPTGTDYSERQVSIADEAIFHAQPALLDSSLAALRRERSGIPDIYFIGFGGDAREDVFMKEVEVIADLFRERFDAEGRTMALINNPKTAGVLPVASATNLARVLRHVGGLMNREEDVLVLYLTSHGSEKHRLAVVNGPLKLLEIDPQMLRRLLDDAGIKWRVIAISACYSGGFVDALKSETTLVMTASAANRQSFGCGTQSDFTYFGKALFDEELRRTHSFTEAFENARRTIADRERAEKHTPSNPQLFVGAAVTQKLREVESRLRAVGVAASGADEER